MSFKEVEKVDKNIKERWKAIDQGLVPKGYKKTKVGIIPDDWDVKKLGEVFETYSGGTPSTKITEYYQDGKIPWIRSTDINKKRIKSVDKYITELGFKNSSAKKVEKGNILLALYGATAGKIAITKMNATINQAILCINSKDVNLGYNNYLYYVLFNNEDRIVLKYSQGGQPNLSGKIIREL